MIPSELWNSYLSTYFKVDFQDFFSNFAIITAWNPASKPLSEVENCANNSRLKTCLQHYNYLPIIAGDKDFNWYEESFIVDIDLDNALTIARNFSQNAIFYVFDGVLYLYACHNKEKRCMGRFAERIIKA